jgi:outer membrane protein assembly factor BamB
LILVSGADRPLTSIVDGATGTVVMRVGRDITGTVDGFGGSLASGHEHWIDDERFFVLDRFAPTIAIYNLRSSGIPVWISETPGPVHHVRPDPEFPGRWYAACEGRPASGIPPSIVVMEADPAAVGGFRVTAVVELPIAAADLRDSGAHHVDIAPGGGLLFVGSAEGNTYGLRRDTLTFVYKGRTGLGCGHTGFVAINGVTRAVTINHFATFVSVLDTKTGQNIVDIEVSNTSSTTRRTQGHTSFVRGEKIYMMASLDADFVEVDLASGAVTRRLNLGISGQRPYPMQGVFVTPPNARMAEGTGRLLTQCC